MQTLGTEQQPGIILLAFSDIFHYIRTHSERKFLLRLGYMEIYNDSVNCLLGDGVDLKPDRPTDDGVAVPGLQYEFVRSPADFLSLLLRGERKRKVMLLLLLCQVFTDRVVRCRLDTPTSIVAVRDRTPSSPYSLRAS